MWIEANIQTDFILKIQMLYASTHPGSSEACRRQRKSEVLGIVKPLPVTERRLSPNHDASFILKDQLARVHDIRQAKDNLLGIAKSKDQFITS